jgi:L-histidine N-alpha-methyltransferase
MTVDIVNENRMLEEVLEGLMATPKTLSPKYFYDKRGAELFEKICKLKEYYPTRTEISILENHIHDIKAALGSRPILYEFGSGSSTKVQILLKHMDDISGYVPIDICREYLDIAADELRVKFPKLKISPTCADFCQKVELNDSVTLSHQDCGRVVFFPGSTIGNFNPEEASKFLLNAASTLGAKGKLLIGVDSVKDIAILESAYNDDSGVTRDFNLNVLDRFNRELGADFDLSCFEHLAFYNQTLHRIEMHLKCIRSCQVKIQGRQISFKSGESIQTESSYKYHPHDFIALAEKSGFQFLRRWNDLDEYFNVFLFEVRPSILTGLKNERAHSIQEKVMEAI